MSLCIAKCFMLWKPSHHCDVMSKMSNKTQIFHQSRYSPKKTRASIQWDRYSGGGVCVCVCMCAKETEQEPEKAGQIDRNQQFSMKWFMLLDAYDFLATRYYRANHFSSELYITFNFWLENVTNCRIDDFPNAAETLDHSLTQCTLCWEHCCLAASSTRCDHHFFKNWKHTHRDHPKLNYCSLYSWRQWWMTECNKFKDDLHVGSQCVRR